MQIKKETDKGSEFILKGILPVRVKQGRTPARASRGM